MSQKSTNLVRTWEGRLVRRRGGKQAKAVKSSRIITFLPTALVGKLSILVMGRACADRILDVMQPAASQHGLLDLALGSGGPLSTLATKSQLAKTVELAYRIRCGRRTGQPGSRLAVGRGGECIPSKIARNPAT